MLPSDRDAGGGALWADRGDDGNVGRCERVICAPHTVGQGREELDFAGLCVVVVVVVVVVVAVAVAVAVVVVLFACWQ
jgi:hypothetical protein